MQKSNELKIPIKVRAEICNNAANRERGNGYEKFGKNRG